MKKKKTHPIHGVLLWALMLGACSETPVGIMDAENNIIMNSIRYLPEGNAEIAEKGDYLGHITDSNNTKIKVWSAADDESGEYLWTDGYMDSTVYRKEYHSMSTEVKTLILGSKEMDYFRFGKEDGEKLVILPGLSLKSVMGSADAIVGAYALLAENYDIYMFDRIRIFPEGYDVEAMADDTLAAMKQLDLSQVHLMGVSQGGMMAQMIALKSPETVKSLVLCSTAARISESSRSVFEEWHKLAEKRDLPVLMASFGEKVYTPSFFEQYKDIIIASAEGAAEQNFANFLISLDGTAGFDVYDRLSEITCPAFVLGAGKDQVLGVNASLEIIDQLGCQSYIYEDNGHGVYDEAPDYLSRIREFLASVH